MSQLITTGTDPRTKAKCHVQYGWDNNGAFGSGYFFQAFDPNDPDRALVNEGFFRPISMEQLRQLAAQWGVVVKAVPTKMSPEKQITI